MGAEASHTDLETPVVWLLMEIREEMVMREREQVRDPWSSVLSHGTWSSILPEAGRK
jgi:hypothetical protein